MQRLTEEPIDFAALTESVRSTDSGAVVLFLGTVRNHAPRQGSVTDSPPRSVVKLTYSAYRLMAQKALHRIAADLESTVKGLRVSIVHRLGETVTDNLDHTTFHGSSINSSR